MTRSNGIRKVDRWKEMELAGNFYLGQITTALHLEAGATHDYPIGATDRDRLTAIVALTVPALGLASVR